MEITDIINQTYKSILWLDFETRSKCDLIKMGAHRYCADSSTEILLTSYAINDGQVNVTEFDNFSEEFLLLLDDPMVLKIAHNADFDMAVLKYVAGIDVRVREWFDTAFQLAYYAHPRNLKGGAERLGATKKGEKDGVLFFSLPIKRKKNEPMLFDKGDFNNPKDYQKEWEAFKDYAKQDVGTMREIFNIMPMLPLIEIFTSQMTMEMNFNGVPFDAKLGYQIYKKALTYEDEAGDIALQKYGITNLKSVQQVQKALRENGVELASLNKKIRLGETHEILDLRDRATGSAFSKLPKASQRMCPDGRLHGEFIGFGAHTGRWSSRGVQLQNWKRILTDVSETLIEVKSYDHLAQHMRLCLGHVAGKAFTCADLSQIEARIVAWLAGSKWRMEAFASGVDIYARSAEKMFNIAHVEKGDKERYYGKCAELGFGYGGGHQAIQNIQPDFYLEEGEAKVRELVQRWRKANPEVVTLWRTLEDGMKKSMLRGSETISCGGTSLTFKYDGKDGKIELPSNRAIYYRSLHKTETGLAYRDYAVGENPRHVSIWGGTLLENVTQAIARDVLVQIMMRIKETLPNIECIATVHDEIWYLHNPNVFVLDVMLAEMARAIPWTRGLVTKGEGFTSDRYRK